MSWTSMTASMTNLQARQSREKKTRPKKSNLNAGGRTRRISTSTSPVKMTKRKRPSSSSRRLASRVLSRAESICSERKRQKKTLSYGTTRMLILLRQITQSFPQVSPPPLFSSSVPSGASTLTRGLKRREK
jgi:hypothetical protein